MSSGARATRLWPILILTALVYLAALLHAPRADQIIYLGEAARMDGLWDLTLGSYAFNRTNQPGDYSLFRPLWYGLLGLEYWLFGYAFPLWQAVSGLLHLGIVALLWQYLRTWTTPLASAFFCAYFAVLHTSMEMVIWHHVAGYLLSCALLVGAARALFPGHGRGSPWLGVALLALASFTYEFGSIAAIAAVVAMLAGRWLGAGKRTEGAGTPHPLPLIAATSAIPAVYLACSTLDFYSRFGALSQFWALRVGPGLVASAVNMVKAGGIWAISGFVPTLLTLRPGGRVDYGGLEPLVSPNVLVGLLLLSVFLVAAARILQPRLDRVDVQMKLPALLFAALTLAGYCAIIVLGRANERGFDFALGNASHYAYPFNLLLIMGAGVLVGRPRSEPSGHLVRWTRLAAAIALISIAVNALGVLRTNLQMVEWSRDYVALIGAADRLQREHRNDRAFTFTVGAPCPVNQPLPWYPRAGRASPPPLLGVLFPATYRDSTAEHVVFCGEH